MANARTIDYDAEEIGFMQVDDTDFTTFSKGEKIRQLEVEGYLVLPGVLDTDRIARLKAELAAAPMQVKDYSDAQTYCLEPQWYSRAACELIGHPPVVDFLRTLMGPDIVFSHGLFTRTLAGSAPISLHTDGQPFGSSVFGFEGSSPRLLRVLYYLDDLPPQRAPFRVVPRSHLCMHADANPYQRFSAHPDEVMVTLKAGSAVLLNHKVFHGNYPNTGTRSRGMLAISYRPAWAGPVQPVDEWSSTELQQLPTEVRELFQSPNHRQGDFFGANKPANMPSVAPGMNVNRWERG